MEQKQRLSPLNTSKGNEERAGKTHEGGGEELADGPDSIGADAQAARLRPDALLAHARILARRVDHRARVLEDGHMRDAAAAVTVRRPVDGVAALRLRARNVSAGGRQVLLLRVVRQVLAQHLAHGVQNEACPIIFLGQL